MVPEDPPPPTLPPPPSTNEAPATGTPAGITKFLPLGEATTKGLHRLASLLQYLTVSGIPDGNINDLLAQFEGLVKPVSTPRDVERLCVFLSKGPCTMQQRTGVPEPATPAPTTGAQTATHSVAGGGSWQPATRTSPRTYAQAVGSAENARPAGHATGMPTRTHKASAREVLMAAVQPVWSTATNPRPKEVILGNLRNTGAVTPPELRRAMSRLTGVSSVELLDISFHGGRCYATLHAAAVPKFTRAVRRGVLDVTDPVTETDRVVVLDDFDELGREALSTMEKAKCATQAEVRRLAARKRLRRLKMLSNRITPRRLPDFAKQAWMAAVEDMIYSTEKSLTSAVHDADPKGPADSTPTPPHDSEDSPDFRGVNINNNKKPPTAALKTVESRASPSGDGPVPVATSSDSEDSKMSCGESPDDDTEMSSPLVLLEKRGGEPTTFSGGKMRKVDEGASGSARRRADRLNSDALFVQPASDHSNAPLPNGGEHQQ